METAVDNFAITTYPAYKDSGAEWIGEIPDHWACIRMKHMFKDVSEKNRPNAELLSVTQDQGVVPRTWVENRMVMPSGALESFKFINEGDFAISLRSFEGGLEYCYHDGIISPAYTVLKSKNKINNKFYKYLFKSQMFISELQTSVIGIRQGKNISYQELSYSFLPIPPLPEQTAIANFLDRKTALIDKAIGIKQKQIELLKERRQILIHNAVTRGLNPNVKMKDSGVEWIGEIPEGWEVKKLKYVVLANPGHSKANNIEKGTQVSFMPMECLRCGNIEEKTIEYEKAFSYVPFENHDVVMAKVTPCFENNNIAVAENLIQNIGFGTSEIFVFRCSELIHNYFLFYFLQTEYIKKIGISSMTGVAGLKRVSLSALMNSLFFIPSMAEQNEIVSYIENQSIKMSTAITLKEQEIEKLKEYKATLTNSAVTGKIKVN